MSQNGISQNCIYITFTDVLFLTACSLALIDYVQSENKSYFILVRSSDLGDRKTTLGLGANKLKLVEVVCCSLRCAKVFKESHRRKKRSKYT